MTTTPPPSSPWGAREAARLRERRRSRPRVRILAALGERVFKVDEHDDPNLAETPASAMKPTPVATDWW